MQENNIRSFRDLEVWKRAMQLALECYRVTAAFPRHEIYGLASQTRRAATSIPANIAEGHARQTRTYRNHVGIALGSQAELETLIELAIALGYVTAQQAATACADLERVGRMLHRLAASLDRNILDARGTPEPPW